MKKDNRIWLPFLLVVMI